ncbi:porin family protein [Fluoribacter dumoffii]|uniref:Opacity protein and related surface antigens n=2 Tax=Fluoribacter dumoffii TaxID=463 RepID=A0A377GAG9_9GAMM|nr:outer membrane beta-barrel protein [Fluoribacter dumoffii]KTC88700.1 hypothetical protein Ldum_2958 [Fluoribacter dumoffii NY 23]MCW8483042.1 porin family protein [Fluoribacter dumoffii]MCW8495698.1 porin family protein [Fluoribacter dumoffii]STO21812.1 Opacity protein and related surface antigens [Fluoribacter dumoffii]
MELKAIAIAALCVGFNGLAVAGAMGGVVPSPSKFYIGAEGGASISLDTQFAPKWGGIPLRIAATGNSDWNTDFGIGGFGGAFIGYQYNPNVAVQFTWDYRSGYDYFLHASYGVVPTDPNLYLEDQFSADDINIQTFLFDLILKPTVNWGGFVPYVKGGIGFAYNQIGTLRNVQHTFFGNPVTYDMRISGDSVTSFAWDAGVGADYFFNNKFSIGLGYRFVDAGTLNTDKTYYDAVNGTSGLITPFATKHVFLNEFVASVAYHFDFA